MEMGRAVCKVVVVAVEKDGLLILGKGGEVM